MTPPGFSCGDAIALAGLVVVTASQIVRAAVGARSGARKALAEGALRAAADATGEATLKSLIAELARLATTLEAQARQYREHELVCADFRARIEEGHARFGAMQADIMRTLEGQQRQITVLALGLAPEAQGRDAARRPSRRRAAQ